MRFVSYERIAQNVANRDGSLQPRVLDESGSSVEFAHDDRGDEHARDRHA